MTRGRQQPLPAFGALLVVLGSGLLTGPVFAGPMFVALGYAANEFPFSEALDVSADGSVVVGRTASGRGTAGFRWTREDGLVVLPSLDPLARFSEANGTSDDGSTAVGSSSGIFDVEATVWNGQGDVIGLGAFSTDTSSLSSAWAVSSDGSKVVGRSRSGPEFQAFYWTAPEGLVSLGDLPGGDVWSDALGISADGQVIVGVAERLDHVVEAFRWTAEEGMLGLGHLSEGGFDSTATAVAPDGSTIVGWSQLDSQSMAIRWTAETGMESLGLPEGDWRDSFARGVSADGKTVVGWVEPTSGTHLRAFVWTEADGMRELGLVLEDAGLDVTGWEFEIATAVSSDGRSIVGWGTNPEGLKEGFLAYVPEPSAALLLGLGWLALRRRTHLQGPLDRE